MHDINMQSCSSVCAVRGFVRTHFLPFTRSDRESRTTLHLLNLWTKPHGFNPYFLHFCILSHIVGSASQILMHLSLCFCQFFLSKYAFLKFCCERRPARKKGAWCVLSPCTTSPPPSLLYLLFTPPNGFVKAAPIASSDSMRVSRGLFGAAAVRPVARLSSLFLLRFER